MEKHFLTFSTAMLCALGMFAQTPYDNFAPEQSVKSMIELPKQQFKVANANTDSEVRCAEFDRNTLSLNLLDKNDSVIKTIALNPNNKKFLTIDPHAENYYSVSPYSFCLGNPMRFIDPDGQDVYMLFYTTGNGRGDEAFSAAAETRKREIEAMKSFNSETDKVIMFGVSDISDIGNLTNWAVNTYSKQFGQTAEVGVWSHTAWNGPIGTEATSTNPFYEESRQMSMEGWSNINFNWKENGAKMGFYGCNTGNDVAGNQWVGAFAREVSSQNNFHNVDVWGQSSSAYPSIYPHIRATTALRSAGLFLNGSTYMVGGNSGEGLKSMWFNPFSSYPSANPMNVYRRGNKVRSAFQGF
jgi:hypothetical protein